MAHQRRATKPTYPGACDLTWPHPRSAPSATQRWLEPTSTCSSAAVAEPGVQRNGLGMKSVIGFEGFGNRDQFIHDGLNAGRVAGEVEGQHPIPVENLITRRGKESLAGGPLRQIGVAGVEGQLGQQVGG